MTTSFEASIVRLHSTEEVIVGGGFLVADRHVLTCAHVVADALGIPRETQEKPTGRRWRFAPRPTWSKMRSVVGVRKQ